MFPPLLRILLDEPGLFTAHAAGYSELVREEAEVLRTRLAKRLGYRLALGGCALLALLFAGMALMLYAVSGKGHWLLWIVPAIPAAGAIVLAALLWRSPREALFPKTRAQFSEDMDVLGLKEAE